LTSSFVKVGSWAGGVAGAGLAAGAGTGVPVGSTGVACCWAGSGGGVSSAGVCGVGFACVVICFPFRWSYLAVVSMRSFGPCQPLLGSRIRRRLSNVAVNRVRVGGHRLPSAHSAGLTTTLGERESNLVASALIGLAFIASADSSCTISHGSNPLVEYRSYASGVIKTHREPVGLRALAE
jgi:hypothetical protein